MAARSVEYEQKKYVVVREGLAEILRPQQPDTQSDEEPQTVFYNPIQQFNRDLSVLAIRVFGEELEASRKLREAQSRLAERRGKKRKRPIRGKYEAEKQTQIEQRRVAPHQESIQRSSAASNGCAIPSFSEEGSAKGACQLREAESENLDAQIPAEPKWHFSLKILDALSATGLRALRYAKEIPQRTTVTANDLSPAAAVSIALHVQHNGLTDQVFPTTGNASAHMYRVGTEQSTVLPDGSRGKYHVIDLDPYGTAAPFLDSAVQATENGGLLCVTCTDAGVFASVGYAEKTFSQYGGLPLRGPHAHEGGIRLILHSIATTAARYGLAIEPLLSLSIDFYVRVFVRVRRSPAEVKFLAGKTMTVYSCDSGCGAWTTQPLARTHTQEAKNGELFHKFSLGLAPTASAHCAHCGLKTHLGGPMWGGPLHNPFFIQRILDLLPSLDKATYHTISRIEGMLSTARDEILLPPDLVQKSSSSKPDTTATPETNGDASPFTPRAALAPVPRLPADLVEPHPFFILPPSLSRVLHCISPSQAELRSALIGLGYRTTRSHTKAGSMRTDAPWKVIWEVMREWAKQHGTVKEGVLKEGTAGKGVMRWARDGDGNGGKEREVLKGIVEGRGSREALVKDLEEFLSRLKDGKADDENGESEELGGSAQRLNRPGYADGLASLNVVFDGAKGREPEAKKLTRYQINPRPNWGPMSKARGSEA